jgi:hypothetical protein
MTADGRFVGLVVYRSGYAALSSVGLEIDALDVVTLPAWVTGHTRYRKRLEGLVRSAGQHEGRRIAPPMLAKLAVDAAQFPSPIHAAVARWLIDHRTADRHPVADIAADCSCSSSAVRLAVRDLRAAGWILVAREATGRRSWRLALMIPEQLPVIHRSYANEPARARVARQRLTRTASRSASTVDALKAVARQRLTRQEVLEQEKEKSGRETDAPGPVEILAPALPGIDDLALNRAERQRRQRAMTAGATAWRSKLVRR